MVWLPGSSFVVRWPPTEVSCAALVLDLLMLAWPGPTAFSTATEVSLIDLEVNPVTESGQYMQKIQRKILKLTNIIITTATAGIWAVAVIYSAGCKSSGPLITSSWNIFQTDKTSIGQHLKYWDGQLEQRKDGRKGIGSARPVHIIDGISYGRIHES